MGSWSVSGILDEGLSGDGHEVGQIGGGFEVIRACHGLEKRGHEVDGFIVDGGIG